MGVDGLKSRIPGFSGELYEELMASAKIASFPSGQIILKEGSYVNVIPIVLKGLLKVSKKEEDKEVLLYYIEPGQSCVMSFSACITSSRSKVVASTQEETTLLLIPSDRVPELIAKYPALAQYFFSLYQMRYEDLIQSIDLLVFRKFDERLLYYLRERSLKTGSKVLKTTHQEIAADMGTLREVVSRTLKKLEKEGRVGLTRNEIEII